MAAAANAMQRSALVFRTRVLRSRSGGASEAAAAAAVPSKRRSAGNDTRREYDVFINHRGVDTKRTVAGLLCDRLVQLGLRAFLDNRSMRPGDKLLDSIHAGVTQAKVGVAIFSPRYCESAYCMHELAMLVESRKTLIPVFCDVHPADLKAEHVDEAVPPEELDRFRRALQAATYNVGLTFDSRHGNWSDLVARISENVSRCINQLGADSSTD